MIASGCPPSKSLEKNNWLRLWRELLFPSQRRENYQVNDILIPNPKNGYCQVSVLIWARQENAWLESGKIRHYKVTYTWGTFVLLIMACDRRKA